MTGEKQDQEKLRWDLLPYSSVEEIVAVLTFGARKYSDDNWKSVPDAGKRYFAAAMRHLVAWEQGEEHDPESGLPHLAHASCCLLFLQWLDANSKEVWGVSAKTAEDWQKKHAVTEEA